MKRKGLEILSEVKLVRQNSFAGLRSRRIVDGAVEILNMLLGLASRDGLFA